MTRPRTSHDYVWVDLLAPPGARSRADELIDLGEVEALARTRRPSAQRSSRRSLGHRGVLIAVVMAFALRLIFTVDAGANITSPPPTISVTTAADRSNHAPLASRTISNDVYVFVAGLPTAATQVRFWIDDPAMAAAPSNIERRSPYDLIPTAKDGTPTPLNTARLTNGAHSISVVVRTSSASDLTLTARFTVDNTASSPAAGGGTPTTVTTAPPTTTTTAAPTTTTTAAPAPTPTTVTSAPSAATTSARLRWAPPALSSPTTIEVGATGGQINLANDRDYIIRLPQKVSAIGGVTLDGGRNVVLIGGHITIPAGAASTTNARRALYLRGQTGTVHVEGLLIDNSGGRLSEGIQINAPQAIVQIQNTRITGIHADDQVGYSDQHPDLIQPWGGARALRIDRFSGSTDYQGFMLKADSNGPLGPVTVSNVNIWPTAPTLSRYLLWQGPDSATFPLAYDNVWLSQAAGRSLGKSVWPDTGASNSSKRAITSDDGTSVWWPAASQITGVIRSGAPPGGDFVPVGLAGLGYSSPGYR